MPASASSWRARSSHPARPWAAARSAACWNHPIARSRLGDVGHPSEHLERLTGDGRLRGRGRPRRRARRAEVGRVRDAPLVEGDVGGDRVHAGAERRVVVEVGAGGVDEPGGLVGVAGGQRGAGQHQQEVGDVAAVRARAARSTSGRPSASAAAGLPAAARICTSDRGRRRARRARRRGARRRARSAVASAVAYAPPANARRALSTSRSAASAGSPAASARSAASSHTAPGSPGLARSTAGQAREARSRRSGGSSSPSTASRVTGRGGTGTRRPRPR